VAEGEARAPWLMLLVLCSVLALHNAMRIGPVPLIEELRGRYGADHATVGNVVGAYTLAYGFAQLAAGLLTDRFGSRRLMLSGLGLGAMGSTVFAVTESYAAAFLARLLMGLAGGCLYTPSVAYLFVAFPADLRGRAMGFAEAGVGTGQVTALLGFPVLFAGLGLTPAFLALPILAVGIGLAVVLALPPIPPAARAGPGSIRNLVRERDFWLLLVGVAFVGIVGSGTAIRLVNMGGGNSPCRSAGRCTARSSIAVLASARCGAPRQHSACCASSPCWSSGSRHAGGGARAPSLTLCERRVYGRQRCAGRNTALRNGPGPRPRT
jgi:MFS family permease